MINMLLNKQAKNKGGINKLIDGKEKITDPGNLRMRIILKKYQLN